MVASAHQKLQRPRDLAETHRTGQEGLPADQAVPKRRALRTNGSVKEVCGLGAFKHSGRFCQGPQKRIQAVSLRGTGKLRRIDNIDHYLCPPRLHEGTDRCQFAERSGPNQQNDNGLDKKAELAKILLACQQLLTDDYRPTTNWLPPSSSGLGYQVLILETGVRLPLGVFFAEKAKNRAGEQLKR